MSDSPIGALIIEATNKASLTSGLPYIARAAHCTCEVEIAFFTPKSSRQRYSRCVEHPVR